MRVVSHVTAADPVEGVGGAIVEVQTGDLMGVPGDQVQVAVAVHVPQRHLAGGVRIVGDVTAADPVEGVGCAVVQVQPVGIIPVTGDYVQVAVAVHVPQRHRLGIVLIGSDVAAADSAEGVGGAVVEVQPVAAIVPGYQVQVAVAVHVPQRYRVGIVRVSSDVAAADPVERGRGAVVEVQPVAAVVPGYQVQVAVAVHVPQRHLAGIIRVGADIAAGCPGAEAVVVRLFPRQVHRLLLRAPVGVGEIIVTQVGIAEVLGER